MRIAYVINSVEGGGAALPVPAVARVMRACGAECVVFALTARDARALPALEAAKVRTVVRDGGETDHVAALAWLDRQLAEHRPDVIWTSLTRATLLGQIVGRRRHAPVVSWQHAAYLKPANRILLRHSRRNSALWVADSNCVQRLTAERLRVPPERLALWPLFAADPHAPTSRPWAPGRRVSLGSLGRLHPVKGYDVLIAALARLRAEGFEAPAPFQLTIAGEGRERAALEAQVREAGLDNVELPGFTPRPLDLLASLHLYLQPSRSEGLCLAAHQAMQAGLPVIASAVGELPYSVVPEETGLVVPPDDPAPLAAALGRLLSRPDRLAAMGLAARERVLARFSAAAFHDAGAVILRRLAFMLSRADAAQGRWPAAAASG